MKLTKISSIYLDFIVFFITSVSICFVLFNRNIVEGFQTLFLLPFSFLFSYTFAIKARKMINFNLPMIIIWGGYFVRFVITPLLLTLGGYKVLFQSLDAENIKYAILLMTYEIFSVFIFIEMYIHNNIQIFRRTSSKRELKFRVQSFANVSLSVLFIVCILILVLLPQIINSFTWFFSNKMDIVKIVYDTDSIAMHGSLDRVLASLFVFISNIIRYLIPVYLLGVLHIKMENDRLKYFLSILISLSPFLMVGESNVQPFLGLIVNVMMISKLYPRNTKTLINIFILIGVFMLLSIFISKMTIMGNSRGMSGISSLSLTLNAYFPGVGNVAAAFNVTDYNKLALLFFDFFSSIPFRNSIFPNLATQEVTLSNIFNYTNSVKGQIIPCISGSAYYVGFLFAPIIPILLIRFSLKLKEKADSVHEFWNYFYYTFYYIYVALIPNLYTHISFIRITIHLFIPLYIITNLFNRIRVTA